ncbi:hypothetical protein B0H10DRAFT_2125787 [Mycena sp. CBHHK59/15]|nr:hypothetical protein B0H10DRAFT_2125787 [Mycena sp. CBHHK59/15]
MALSTLLFGVLNSHCWPLGRTGSSDERKVSPIDPASCDGTRDVSPCLRGCCLSVLGRGQGRARLPQEDRIEPKCGEEIRRAKGVRDFGDTVASRGLGGNAGARRMSEATAGRDGERARQDRCTGRQSHKDRGGGNAKVMTGEGKKRTVYSKHSQAPLKSSPNAPASCSHCPEAP